MATRSQTTPTGLSRGGRRLFVKRRAWGPGAPCTQRLEQRHQHLHRRTPLRARGDCSRGSAAVARARSSLVAAPFRDSFVVPPSGGSSRLPRSPRRNPRRSLGFLVFALRLPSSVHGLRSLLLPRPQHSPPLRRDLHQRQHPPHPHRLTTHAPAQRRASGTRWPALARVILSSACSCPASPFVDYFFSFLARNTRNGHWQKCALPKGRAKEQA